MFGQAAADLKTRDLTIVQRAVPAHMLCLMVEQCTKNGFELRPDVLYKLNLAAAAPMAGCDMLSVARLARRVDEVATTLLHDLSPDDARHGLYCCAMFVLTLVEEGRMADKTNQAVLISLLLLDDVADERKDSNDAGAVWRLEETKWKEEAKKLLQRALLIGLYHKEDKLVAA